MEKEQDKTELYINNLTAWIKSARQRGQTSYSVIRNLALTNEVVERVAQLTGSTVTQGTSVIIQDDRPVQAPIISFTPTSENKAS